MTCQVRVIVLFTQNTGLFSRTRMFDIPAFLRDPIFMNVLCLCLGVLAYTSGLTSGVLAPWSWVARHIIRGDHMDV
jgi:hypothetical protein